MKEELMEKNLALIILKEIYSQGDDYFSMEDDDYWKASFSNDYPMQHGYGWSLYIKKSDLTFTIGKEGICYHNRIKGLIEKYGKSKV